MGGKRNRTAEAILGTHRGEDSRRVPKLITNGGGRKTVRSFSGNINIGLNAPEERSNGIFASKLCYLIQLWGGADGYLIARLQVL